MQNSSASSGEVSRLRDDLTDRDASARVHHQEISVIRQEQHELAMQLLQMDLKMGAMELQIHDLEAGCLVLYKQLIDERCSADVRAPHRIDGDLNGFPWATQTCRVAQGDSLMIWRQRNLPRSDPRCVKVSA